MAHCTHCGAQAPGLAKFCNRCGASLDEQKRGDIAPLLLSMTSRRPQSVEPGSSPSQALNSLVALDRTTAPSITPAARGAMVADRYRLVRVVGRGGLGVVYRAWDERDERLVAVKILLTSLMNNPSILRRFREQVLPLERLKHTRIVPILDAGSTAECAYLVMPLLPGKTLRSWIRSRTPRRRKPEDVIRAVGWARQVAEGLAYAHRFVVHRDLKPENVLVDQKGFAVISDFDLAKFRRPSPLTLTGQTFGTAYYMAPEQIRDPAHVDGRADLFSLGVVLYEMITGILPVGAFRAPSRLLRACPEFLDEIILNLLSPEPAGRYPNAGTVVAVLGKVLEKLVASPGTKPGDGSPVKTKAPTLLTRLAQQLLEGGEK